MAKKVVQLSKGLQRVEALTETFASKRAKLVDLVGQLESDLEKAKKPYLRMIRAAAEETANAKGELDAAIKEQKADFEKPKTRVFHGIRVGFRKLVGTLLWEDGAQVVKLIKKHFADRADVLIKTTETPVKDALAQLPAADLKRLGVSVQDDTDEVVIRPTDSDVDKLVDALLADAPEARLKAAS